MQFYQLFTLLLLAFFTPGSTESRKNLTESTNFLTDFIRYRQNTQNVSLGCSSVLDYMQNNARLEEWIFKIFDANAVPESGLADGNIQFLGQFDQCLDQRVPSNVYNGSVTNPAVQYCTVNIPISMILDENESKIYPPFILQMVPPQAGICLPALCSADNDLPRILSAFTQQTNMSLQLANCVTEKDLSFRNRFHLRHFIILAVYGLIIALGIADCFLPTSSSDSSLRRAIACFGFVKNFLSLLKRPLARPQSSSTIPFVRKPSIVAANATPAEYLSSSTHSLSSSASFTSSSESSIAAIDYSSRVIQTPAPKPKLREIECLHGIRFISFFFILIYHTFTGAQVPSANLLALMRAELSFVKQFVTNAALWVDTFFVIGGFLTCHTLLSRASPQDTVLKHFIEHPKRLFHRYIRLTPSVAGVISLSILVEALGSGPLWFEYNFISESTCHKNWWLPITYLHNIVNLNQLGQASHECLPYLWYLAVDMQFFLVSPFLVAFLVNSSKTMQKIGVAINLGTISASLLYSYWLISKDNLTPTVLVTVYDLKYINDVYKSSLCRIGPYCVGILFAYFLHKVYYANESTKNVEDDESEHNSRFYGFALLVGGLSLIFGVTVLTYPWLHNGSYKNFFSALYGATHRSVWAFGWTLVIYVCVARLLPALNSFLSCSVFQFLSKLTYQNYLVHDIIISAVLFSTRQKVYFSDFNLISETIQYLAITIVVSIGTYLMFEKPATNLQMTFLK